MGLEFVVILRRVALALALAVTAQVAKAASGDCPASGVVVRIEGQGSHAAICRGAEVAVTFFRRCGLENAPDVEVRIEPELQPVLGAPAFALYDAPRALILIADKAASRRAFHRQPRFRGLAFGELYASLIAHETAHRLIAQRMSPVPLGLLEHEYIAGVVQLASLSPTTRHVLSQRMNLRSTLTTDDFSSTYYYLNPLAFAVQAHRHYHALVDGCGFLRDIVDGRFAFPDPAG